MTVTAPPRPPGPSDPLEREEVEALIEEARQRTRRRRLIYTAVIASVALACVVGFAVFQATEDSEGSSPAFAASPSAAPSTASAQIAFTFCRSADPTGCELRVIDLDTGKEQTLAHFPAIYGAPHPVWSPDGRRIAFMSVVGDSEEIAVINADGGNEQILTHDPASDQGPAWSPDGRTIAFGRSSPVWSIADGKLYVVNADGGGERMLAYGYGPVWSPDGRKLAFGGGGGRGPDYHHGVSVINGDGSGLRRLPTRDETAPWGDAPAAWSSDGSKILFERPVGRSPSGREPGRVDLYVLNADGSEQRLLMRDTWSRIRSPDGGKVVVERDGGIDVMNTDGSGERRLTEHGRLPIWSPDGRALAFSVSSADGFVAIHVVNADGSGGRRIARVQAFEEVAQVAWSPSW